MEKKLVSVAEAARIVGIHYSTFYRMFSRGEVPVVREGLRDKIALAWALAEKNRRELEIVESSALRV